MNQLDSLVKEHCGRIPVKFRQYTGGLTRTSQLVNMYNQSGTYKSFKDYLQEDIIQANLRLGVKYTPPRDRGMPSIPIHVENSTRPSVLYQTSNLPVAIPVAQRITETQEVGTQPEISLSELVANEMMRELYPKEPRGEPSEPTEREEELRRRVEFLEGVERPILIGREQEAMEETERVEGELEDISIKRDIENAYNQTMMKNIYKEWYDSNFESLSEARQQNVLSNNEFKTLSKSEKVDYLSDILGSANIVKELLEQQMTEFVEEAE